ncbi:unnamed protein product [Ranitomeya imitator]|uniref:Uncharacterized protein n=1 Tax=Ranitomeya imitator TaxID=111125 RepID=A0ABN9M3M5_9NEOB|nr:unnamed protein product [Ranitomeya imitator]
MYTHVTRRPERGQYGSREKRHVSQLALKTPLKFTHWAKPHLENRSNSSKMVPNSKVELSHIISGRGEETRRIVQFATSRFLANARLALQVSVRLRPVIAIPG